MRFPGQEYWSGLLFLSPGDLPDLGIDPMSSTLAGRFFTTEPPRKPLYRVVVIIIKHIIGQEADTWHKHEQMMNYHSIEDNT